MSINNKKTIFIKKFNEHLINNKNKLALFDLDDTLIKYVNHTNPLSKHEWIPLFPNIIHKLRLLNNEGYLIGIISNQLNLYPHLKTFSKKLTNFLSGFDFPVIFVASLEYDMFRKPLPGSFYLIKEMIDCYEEGFYVGDAAGRRNDHSCCDIKFAYNCKLDFYTPEAFFLKKENVFLDFFNIKECKNTFTNKSNKNFVVVFGKGMNSGKNHFCDSNFKEYFVTRELKLQKKKTIFINLMKFNDLFFIIKTVGKENISVYFLDYSKKIIHFLRTFSKFTGKKSLFNNRNNEFTKFISKYSDRNTFQMEFFRLFGLEVKFVDFSYDDTNFSEIKKKICQYYL